MRLKSVLITIGCGLAFLLLVVWGFIFWMADPFELTSPTDKTLTDLFHTHHKAFEQLKEMALDDALETPLFSKSMLKDSRLSTSRQATYQHLFAEIDPKLMGSVEDGRVRIIFAEGAVLTIGAEWIKGIEYLPGVSYRDGVVLRNLDHLRTKPAGVYLQPIEPKWFLFYQRNE